MNTKYKQERIGDFIQVHSGKHFYALDPRPEDITVEDIAHSLSNLCRYTGHSDRFYSVAEHSIICARIARKLGLPTIVQLYALGHDASESVVNDLARPVKQNIPQYKDVEDKIMSVMWEVIGLPEPTENDYSVIKWLDNTLLTNELEQIMKRDMQEYPDVAELGFYVDLTYGYGAGEAKEDFLSMYYNLTNELRENGGI